MRILMGNDNVREIFNIFATPCWCEKEGTTETNPEMYSVAWEENGWDECPYIGEYKLDGTIETYNAAVKNFEEICEKLLTKGYCKQSDFKNFTFY